MSGDRCASSKTVPQASFSLFGSSRFFSGGPTYVITHGYQSSDDASWVREIASELRIDNPFSNIILTDWSDAADNLNYFRAADDTFDIGVQLGQLLAALPISGQNTTLIGHSLGAHVSGIAGDVYDDLTGQDIGTIVGLDPAGPAFEDELFSSARPLNERLDASDADRVIAFHTSETLGFDEPLGDVDLYFNPDDLLQPGQFTFAGNHSYAHEVYIDLLQGQRFVQPNGAVLSENTLDTVRDGAYNVFTA